MMTGAHPRISCPLSVTGAWWDFAAKFDQFNRLETATDIRAIVDAVADHERLQLWNVDFNRDAIAAQIEPGRFDQIVDAFHSAAAEAEGKSRWANMDIATLFHFERAATLFPNGKFVQITRDGRDVAISFKGYRFGGLNILEIADRWSRATVAADRIGQALGPDRYLPIRYEDLIAHPVTTLSRLCSFIGEDYSPEMLAYAEDVKRKVPADKRDLWPVLDRPPQTDKIDRWRREMSRSERYVFEENAGEALAKFSYETVPQGFSTFGELRGAWCWLTRGARLKRLRRD